MSRDVLLFIAVFIACAVEGVEAVTIVLAAGLTRGWRSALVGASAALVVLAAIVAALGPALTVLPIDVLRLVVGGLLLIFGLQWLRKAILRASGFKPLHDEEAIFAAELAAARAAGREPRGIDGYGFLISFKGVLLEGLGGRVHRRHLRLEPAQRPAGGAFRRCCGRTGRRRGRRSASAAEPGAREHAQVRRRRDAHRVRHLLGRRRGRSALAGWRCGDPCFDRVDVRHLNRACGRDAPEARSPSRYIHVHADDMVSRLRALGAFLYDFVVGDDPLIAAAVAGALGLTAAIASVGVSAWWILPVVVPLVLSISLSRATRC